MKLATIIVFVGDRGIRVRRDIIYMNNMAINIISNIKNPGWIS